MIDAQHEPVRQPHINAPHFPLQQALRAFDPTAKPAPAETGVSAETAGDAAEPDGDDASRPVPSPMPRCGYGAHWADALAAAAEAALTVGPPRMGWQPEVLVHLDLELLRRGDEDSTGRAACRVDEGPDLTREVARRITCDCELRSLLFDGKTGATLDVGRRRRTPTAAQRTALWVRDGGCRFPGCGQRRYVDAHHIVHWTDGGPTSMPNLVLLCRLCRVPHNWHYADRPVMPTGR